MADPSIDECFHLLKLRRGCSYSSVKQAYRKNLYKCHPDRFQAKPELLPAAERKTKRLVQIYGILEQWYEQNGGSDPGTSFGSPTTTGASAEYADDFADEADDPPNVRRFRLGLAVAAVVAVGGTAAWWFLFPAPDPTFAPMPKLRKTPLSAPAPVPKPATSAAPAPVVDVSKAGLAELIAERDRVKLDWIAAYLRAGDARKQAAAQELADARAQYGRDVEAKASEIREVHEEIARQREEAKRQSALARGQFAAQEQAYLDSLRASFETWREARGREAVAKVDELRKRDTSVIGVFSDTEDPKEIFEFWTPGQAGSPEINIAAKTGVTVLQPEERYFPHFRSNIFLYDAEGQVLVRMMETMVEKSDALDKETNERKLADEAEIAAWDSRHPASPPRLSAAQESVMNARKRAIERLAAAKAQDEAAQSAATDLNAPTAFDSSPIGQEWANRIAVMQKSVASAPGKH